MANEKKSYAKLKASLMDRTSGKILSTAPIGGRVSGSQLLGY